MLLFFMYLFYDVLFEILKSFYAFHDVLFEIVKSLFDFSGFNNFLKFRWFVKCPCKESLKETIKLFFTDPIIFQNFIFLSNISKCWGLFFHWKKTILLKYSCPFRYHETPFLFISSGQIFLKIKDFINLPSKQKNTPIIELDQITLQT